MPAFRPTVADSAWALFWGGLVTAGTVVVAQGDGRPWAGLLLGLLAIALLAVRRTHPRISTAGLLVWLVTHTLVLSALSFGAAMVATALAYCARRWAPPRWRVGILSALVVGIAGYLLGGTPELRDTELEQRLFLISWSLALVTIGALAGEVRRRAAEAADRAIARLRLELQLQREQFERAEAAQRTMIAREVHDIVTHTLGAIVAQADGGRYADDPAKAQHALETISRVGRTSVRQMRGLVGMLRTGDGRDVAPVDGHQHLDRLLEEVRSGGLDVTLTVRGEAPAEVPADVSLAIYRIIQESLTNARRHGAAAVAHVSLGWQDHCVHIEISNPGADATHNGVGGHGLAGLQERVALIGGTFEAGPSDEVWRVRAELPWEEQ